MEASILTSTKKVLGISDSYTAFDLDIITHINSVFSILDQLGIGPPGGFMIEDETAVWADLEVSLGVPIPQNQLNLIRTYIILRVRLLFDPPTTSYLIEAVTKQIAEYEWRLSSLREDLIPLPPDPLVVEEVVW